MGQLQKNITFFFKYLNCKCKKDTMNHRFIRRNIIKVGVCQQNKCFKHHDGQSVGFIILYTNQYDKMF